MCGIVGVVGPDADRAPIERMTDRLRHRGPDDGSVFVAPGARLGHRRLSILDLSPAGRQPMTFGPFTLVYNGEIYNYRELRRELEGPFASGTDTEVVLRLFAREGPSCVRRFEGMFAFAIWDAKERRLFAARDRLGIKPFYYSATPEGLAFASELKALLVFLDRPVDRSALADYFTYKYVPTPKTVYSGIQKLPPAHTLTYDGTVRLEEYWRPSTELKRTDPAAAREELRGILRSSVESHTVADVPVGVFLSGGVDSSAIAAHLDHPRTFTVGFDVEEHSELPYARLAADRFGAEHQEETVGLSDIDEALGSLREMFDEPFGDSSGWATYVVSRAARRSVKVVLSGEGGDETFSGYGWYGRWLRSRPGILGALAGALPPFSPAGRSAQRRVSDPVERYAALVGLFTLPQRRALLAPDLVARDVDPLWHFRTHWRPELDPVKRLQWLDLHTYLPDDILVKVDRASMAVSLEVRPPLLDHRLVEFSLSLDSAMLRKDGEGKILFRRVLDGKVPREILERPKKGFSMPVRAWIRQRPRILEEALRRLSEAGVLRSPRPRRFDSEQIWSLLVLDRWLNR
jgi:asparagine synthase (glutamine-hydrolysing)